MLKNVRLKKILKKTIFPILTIANKAIPKDDNIVILYSPNRGIEHNLKPFRDYLIENHFNERYRIICCVSSPEYYENDGLEYVTQRKGISLFFRASHVFYTTGQIPIKPSKQQNVVHMDHGSATFKKCNLLSNINNGDDFYFTKYCISSEDYREIVKAEFACGDENLIVNSEPVTDVFFTDTPPYDLGAYKKIGIWAPTFRQSDYLGYNDSNEEELLPTLSIEDYEEFNQVLKKNDIKLFVKLHDMQDLTKYKNLAFSNLEILSGSDFAKRYDTYRFMKQCDFMIADYSSIFFHFLLLDRPIGFAIPDFDEYKEKRGFVFDDAKAYMPGNKIYNKEDLYAFISSLSGDDDQYCEQRKIIANKIHGFTDGKSCERLIEIAKMQFPESVAQGKVKC